MLKKIEAQQCDLLSPGNEKACTDTDTNPEPDDQEPFDWESDPSVVLHDQAAVAVYFNRFHELVVKQRDTLGAPEAAIFVAPVNVEKFVHGLRDRALPAPKKLKVVDGGAHG